MKTKPLLALAAGQLLSSCKEVTAPEDCAVLEVAATPITGWDGNPYCFATPVASGQYQTCVINSAAEWQALNHCTTTPTIDFGCYTLLAGKTKTAACSSVQA
jgi:poly(3-hydroxybutyrate) depolymerase